LWDLLDNRQPTLDELVADAVEKGYYLDDDVLFQHCVQLHTYPQGAKYCRGPAEARELGGEDRARLAVSYLFNRID
jgi:hypothetical protein